MRKAKRENAAFRDNSVLLFLSNARLLTGTPPSWIIFPPEFTQGRRTIHTRVTLRIVLAPLQDEKFDKILHTNGLSQLKNFTLVFQPNSPLPTWHSGRPTKDYCRLSCSMMSFYKIVTRH